MKNDKILDAIGLLDDAFLEQVLADETTKPRKRIQFGRTFRNLLIAVLTVVLLGCIVLANSMPDSPKPGWESYDQADVLLDVMFGTRRYTPREGMFAVQHKLIGKLDDGTAQYEEVRTPILSGASREPVSDQLAALVKPYIIPVGKSVVDPTGTITLEIMAYYYEPESQCGAVYLKLIDPTGEFCGYMPEDPGVVQTPGEEIKTLKGIEIYLQTFTMGWGKPQSVGGPSHLRYVEHMSDETTWTYVAYFFCDNYDTVDLDIGFVTEPMVDHRPHRIDIDLERTPTMNIAVFGNAANKKSIHISPVGMWIGEGVVDIGAPIWEVVLHFEDGTSYVVVDDEPRMNAVYKQESITYGYTTRANNWFAFANIIDVNDIYYVEVNGCHYFEIDW